MKRDESEERNFKQVIGYSILLVFLSLLGFLYSVHKGRTPLFDLSIPIINLAYMSLYGVAFWLFSIGLYMFTQKKIFKHLSWIGLGWFLWFFILIDIS
jgi:hypothetical protein